MLANTMDATLLYRNNKVMKSGAIMEMVIWKLPNAEPGREHAYKYRLYYGKDGKRLIGYDNERGKSDHRHLLDREESYRFRSVERLIDDFLADVERLEAES